METVRKPFQGVWNIVRFNWHFYFLALFLALILFVASYYFSSEWSFIFKIASACILFVNLSSLLASYYVYDNSKLYQLPWLNHLKLENNKHIVNINAGFDETSDLIQQKFKNSKLTVLDFYDAKKHTEVSIKRARKAYPPYPGTRQISTDTINLPDNSVDLVCGILSVHEIRNLKERENFFKELKRILKPNGKIVVTEHLRDFPNFLAYTIGFFHFHSKNAWQKTFEGAGLNLCEEIKTTPFISTFMLEDASKH